MSQPNLNMPERLQRGGAMESPENAGEGEGARCAYQKMQEVSSNLGT